MLLLLSNNVLQETVEFKIDSLQVQIDILQAQIESYETLILAVEQLIEEEPVHKVIGQGDVSRYKMQIEILTSSLTVLQNIFQNVLQN